eukprot:scaffold24096_cov64-Phaeocystis_antarctica.AAC.18
MWLPPGCTATPSVLESGHEPARSGATAPPRCSRRCAGRLPTCAACSGSTCPTAPWQHYLVPTYYLPLSPAYGRS